MRWVGEWVGGLAARWYRRKAARGLASCAGPRRSLPVEDLDLVGLVVRHEPGGLDGAVVVETVQVRREVGGERDRVPAAIQTGDLRRRVMSKGIV